MDSSLIGLIECGGVYCEWCTRLSVWRVKVLRRCDYTVSSTLGISTDINPTHSFI